MDRHGHTAASRLVVRKGYQLFFCPRESDLRMPFILTRPLDHDGLRGSVVTAMLNTTRVEHHYTLVVQDD